MGHVTLRLQEIVTCVSGSYGRNVLWKSSEALIMRLQARIRGHLIRQQLETRRHYLGNQTQAVVIIQVRNKGEHLLCHRINRDVAYSMCVCTCVQAQWRRFIQQRAYRQRLQYLSENWRSVVKVILCHMTWPLDMRLVSATMLWVRLSVRFPHDASCLSVHTRVEKDFFLDTSLASSYGFWLLDAKLLLGYLQMFCD